MGTINKCTQNSGWKSWRKVAKR